MSRFVVCGIGSRLRADDAAGPLVIDELRKRDLPQPVLLLDCGPAPESFAGKILSFRPDTIIMVDAVQMNRPPGEIAEIPADRIKGMFSTTHKMPLTLFIEYMQRSLPKAKIAFFGIQQGSTVFGKGPGEECKKAVYEAASIVEKTLRKA